MNAQTAIATTILKQSDLSHLPIIDTETSKTIGRISHLWINPRSHRVESITCKSGVLKPETHTFSWSQIDTIGRDSLMICLSAVVEVHRAEENVDPVGHELWTDAGNQIGVIDDVVLDPRNGEVLMYLFDTNGRLGALDAQFQLMPADIISMGQARMIAPMSAIKDADVWASGLGIELAQTRSSLVELGTQLKSGGQQLSQQVGQQAKTQLTKTSERASGKLNYQVHRQVSDVTAQLNQKGQQLGSFIQQAIAEVQTRLHQ